MEEKNKIRAVEMVRCIRNEMAAALEGKSHSEIIEFFKAAGTRGQRAAGNATPTKRDTHLPPRGNTA